MARNLENIVSTTTGEKKLNELKDELCLQTGLLEERQVKLMKLYAELKCCRKQEELFRKEAYALNKTALEEQLKLEQVRRQSEAYVEAFIEKINCSVEAQRHMLEINGCVGGKKSADGERRKRYFKLRGEIEALLLYREYQECILDEINK